MNNRFEYLKDLAREMKLVRYKEALKLLRGSNTKMNKFKNSFIKRNAGATAVAGGYLKLTFSDFARLGEFPDFGEPTVYVTAPYTDAEQWNALFDAGGSLAYFTDVEVNGFEVTLRGNTDLMTVLGNSFGINLVGVELNGFPNLNEFYFDGDGNGVAINSLIIDAANALDSVSFDQNELSVSELNTVLQTLADGATIEGYVNLHSVSGETVPTNVAAISTLTDRNWMVQVDS